MNFKINTILDEKAVTQHKKPTISPISILNIRLKRRKSILSVEVSRFKWQ
jgi:hypothetical protein